MLMKGLHRLVCRFYRRSNAASVLRTPYSSAVATLLWFHFGADGGLDDADDVAGEAFFFAVFFLGGVG